jgi:hypothetical protein
MTGRCLGCAGRLQVDIGDILLFPGVSQYWRREHVLRALSTLLAATCVDAACGAY